MTQSPQNGPQYAATPGVKTPGAGTYLSQGFFVPEDGGGHPGQFLFAVPEQFTTAAGIAELVKIARVPERQLLRIATIISLSELFGNDIGIRIIAWFLLTTIGQGGKGRDEYLQALSSARAAQLEEEEATRRGSGL